MNHVVFAVPGDLATPTGGFVYDARIVEGLRARGWTVDVADLGAHFPYPDGPALHFARNAFAKMRMGGVLVVDGLAFGVMPETAPALAGRHRLIALVHHPLAFETGVSAEDAARFRESERAALACAHHVIVTSPSTARLLTAEYDVRAENITVIRPGNVRAAPHPPRAADGKNVELLAVGSLVPRKGYDVLIAALATLAELPWRLTIVGERRDEATAKAIDAAIARLRLGSRVRMVGAVPAEKLSAFYREADLFVLASRFEGYGMAYSE
ncbi:MAG: glycosyltransferase family 4 protein, partial [Pseudorhodoplanes sp.]